MLGTSKQHAAQILSYNFNWGKKTKKILIKLRLAANHPSVRPGGKRETFPFVTHIINKSR